MTQLQIDRHHLYVLYALPYSTCVPLIWMHWLLLKGSAPCRRPLGISSVAREPQNLTPFRDEIMFLPVRHSKKPLWHFCPPFIGHLPACLSSLGGPCRSTKTPWQRRTDRARAFETSAYVFLRSPRHVRTSNKNYTPQEIHRNELQTLELASPAATCSQHQHTVAAKDLATTFLLGRAPPAVCWGRRILFMVYYWTKLNN